MSTVDARTVTPEDLLEMPEGKSYELVAGELVERTMGAQSEWVGGEVFRRLASVTTQPRTGWLWGAAAGFQCFPNEPARVRRPDCSYIRLGRFPGEIIPRGHIPIPPDLAVEVISPNDVFADVAAKVREYLDAGVRLVWVVNPDTREVQVYRQDGTTSLLRDEEQLTGEDVVPDFQCLVGDLFPPTQPA